MQFDCAGASCGACWRQWVPISLTTKLMDVSQILSATKPWSMPLKLNIACTSLLQQGGYNKVATTTRRMGAEQPRQERSRARVRVLSLPTSERPCSVCLCSRSYMHSWSGGLSPSDALFPVPLRDLPSTFLHDVHPGPVEAPGFAVSAELVIHPGPTLGYRVGINGRALAYLPNHEPALGSPAMEPPA